MSSFELQTITIANSKSHRLLDSSILDFDEVAFCSPSPGYDGTTFSSLSLGYNGSTFCFPTIGFGEATFCF
jgi:hypothetical protein